LTLLVKIDLIDRAARRKYLQLHDFLPVLLIGHAYIGFAG
jgi:hypothetical protein